MYADGAVAAILKKEEKTNIILSYYAITNGTLADELKVPLGGTRIPISGQNCQNYSQYVKVEDNQKLEHILSGVYLKNYINVIKKSLEKSGYSVKNLDFLFINQLKQSLLNNILDILNLSQENTLISLTEYGHIGAGDTLFCLGKALENNRIQSDNIVVLASSASGFSWAALTIKFDFSTY